MELTEFQKLHPVIASQTRWKTILFYKQCVHCKLEIEGVFLSENDGYQPYAYTSTGELVTFNIDHIIPRSKNGPNRLSNYQCLCLPCNQKKGNDPESMHYTIQEDDYPADYLEQMHSRKYKNFEDYPDWKPYYGF